MLQLFSTVPSSSLGVRTKPMIGQHIIIRTRSERSQNRRLTDPCLGLESGMLSSSGFAGQHPAFRGAAGGGRQGAASRSARLGGFPAAQAQDAACRAGGRR